MTKPFLTTTLALCAMLALPARAELSTEQLARIAQNPVGAMISVPFQNNTNFNVGPQNGTQDILNIQPVIPFEINKDWNLITRTIIPLVWQAGTTPTKAPPSVQATSSSRPRSRRPRRPRRA